QGIALFDILTEDSPRHEVYRSILNGQTDSTAAEALLIGPNERTFVSQGLQSVFNLATTQGPLQHRVEAGLRYHFDSIDRRHSQDSFLLVSGEPYPDGSGTMVTTANRASTHALAGHAAYALTFRSVTLTP